MGMLDQFQKLDELIVENTRPPIRTMLRNQLALTREQVEAYQAASDKQDHTLSRQAKTIAALQKTNQELVEKYEKPHAEKHNEERTESDVRCRCVRDTPEQSRPTNGRVSQNRQSQADVPESCTCQMVGDC